MEGLKPINKLNQKLFASYLEDGEEIVLILHKHILFLIRKLTVTSVLFFVIPIFLHQYLKDLPLVPIIYPALLIYGGWRIFYQTISWYFNTLLVTNLNLVQITWNSFFDKSAVRIEYNQIESFSYGIVGLLNTILNNGDLVITKNSGAEIKVDSIYRARKQTQILTTIQDHFVSNHSRKQTGAIKDLLTSMLEAHILEHGLVIDDDK